MATSRRDAADDRGPSAIYRSPAGAGPRVLTVLNHPLRVAVKFAAAGAAVALAGAAVVWSGFSTGSWTHGATGALAVLVGVMVIAVGLHGARDRTTFTVEGDALVITRASGTREELGLAVVVGADVGVDDGEDPAYRVRILLREGGPVFLDDVRTGARDHYAHTARVIARFIREAKGA